MKEFITKGVITKEQFEQIQQFCLVQGKENSPKNTGRPKKSMPDNFLEVYYRWAFGEMNLNQAVKELNMSKGTFYRMLNEKGLLKKDNVRIKREADKVLMGVNGNKLVVSNNMPIDKVVEVIKQAIQYVGIRLCCASDIETFDECVCVYILYEWGQNNKWVKMSIPELCEKVEVSSKTYYKNRSKILEQGGERYFKEVANNIRLI